MLKPLLFIASSFAAFFVALSSKYICCQSEANSTCYEQDRSCLGSDPKVLSCCCHNNCSIGSECCCNFNDGCPAEQKLAFVPMLLPEDALSVVKGELINHTTAKAVDEL